MALTGSTSGLVSELVARLSALSKRLGKDIEVTSGKRSGPADASAHNSGIAADVKVAGMNTIAMADELVKDGFTGVGEYYEADKTTPRAFAHGDIRGLPGSEQSGAYRPGGAKSAPLCWTGDGEPPKYSFGSRRSGHPCPKKSPDGAILAEVVEPLSRAFTGHGTFLYSIAQTIQRYGSIEDMVKAATASSMKHVWMRVHGRTSPYGDPALNKEAIAAFREAGLSVAGWGWCQGEDIPAEADLAVNTITALGLSDYVADIEQDVNQSHWTEQEVETFLGRVRQGLPLGGSLAVSTFGLIDWHEPGLMLAANSIADAFAPQVYWFDHPNQKMIAQFGHLGTFRSGHPEDYASLCLTLWKRLVTKPIIMTGQAYWKEAGFEQRAAEEKLDQLIAQFTRWEELAALNWWHFGSLTAMSPRMLESLRSVPPIALAPHIPPQ